MPNNHGITRMVIGAHKKAGKKNDARSRKIAAALRLKREGIAKPSAKATKQSTLNF